MQESANVWGIQEFMGDGENCPITPKNLPFYKKFVLFFFRFGICPMCVTMSLGFNLMRFVKKMKDKWGVQNALVAKQH
jgi:hypothetical protein